MVVSQAVLAAPLASEHQVSLFCNGVRVCMLSSQVPNARLRLDRLQASSFECVGPAGSGVHISGYTCRVGRPAKKEFDGGQTAEEYEAVQEGRKRRLEQLAHEAKVAQPSTKPKRIPRLTFNPEVLVAEYSPKQSGISPVRAQLSLDAMVAAREEIKARQELESMGGGDDGETLQHVLAELLACSAAKLRSICKANELDEHGGKSALVERLTEHIAACLREERAVRL